MRHNRSFLDLPGPAGTLTLDNNISQTSTSTIPVSAPATDPSGVTQMRISNTAAFDATGLLTV